MSRSYNKHDKSWNYPKREAKYYSKKLVDELEKVDGDDAELAIDIPKNAGKGDIWIYD